MKPEIIQMSQQEVDRLTIIQRVKDKQMSQRAAAEQLGLSTKQIRRLQRLYCQQGAKGLVSKKRGNPSNNRLDEDLKKEVVSLIAAHYHDFGPTLAHEKLTEQHGLKLSVESTRTLMLQHGIWKGKKRKKIYVHQMRQRRSQFGDLVQIDGSLHAWFEGRAPKCCLHVFIDDATSNLIYLYFAPTETLAAYFVGIKNHLTQYGRPLAYYS